MEQAKSKRPQAKKYFPKDYAPARIIAEQRRSQTTLGKFSNRIRKLSHQTQQQALQTTKKLAKKLKSASPRSLTKSSSAVHHSRSKITLTKSHLSDNAQSINRRSQPKIILPKPTAHSFRFSWREGALLSIIGTSALAIVFALIYSTIFDPSRLSQRELEKLANAYYIEYLYPRTLGKNLDHPSEILSTFKDSGLPIVHLHQLLLYNNGQYADSASVFSNQYYECNSDQTFVRYYPVEPYGPRDYTVYYGPACERVGVLE